MWTLGYVTYSTLGSPLYFCTVRLSVRTPAFHVGKMGSIPIRCTILKHIAEVGSVRQGDPIAYVVSVF